MLGGTLFSPTPEERVQTPTPDDNNAANTNEAQPQTEATATNQPDNNTVTNGSLTSPGIVAPRFGGTIAYGSKVYPFVGGTPNEDFTGIIETAPCSPNWLRNISPDYDCKSYNKRVLASFSKHYKPDDPKYPLPEYLNALSRRVWEAGDYALFCMVGADSLGAGAEDIFQYHPKYTKSMVTDHLKLLQTNKLLDSYGMTSLHESGEYVMESLDPEYRNALSTELEEEKTGIGKLMIVIADSNTENFLRIYNMNEEFKNMKLSDFPGENVKEYVSAVSRLLTQIERARELYRGHHLLVIVKQFTHGCSVNPFKFQFMARRPQIDKFLRSTNGKTAAVIAQLPDREHFRALLKEGKEAYENLLDEWGPASALRDNNSATPVGLLGAAAPAAGFLGAFEARIDRLDQAIAAIGNGNNGNRNNGNRNNGNRNDVKCRCGGGHADGTCPNKFRTWDAPGPNDPKSKTLPNGQVINWCGRCKRGTGAWTNNHTEATHDPNAFQRNRDARANNQGNNAGGGAAGNNQGANANAGGPAANLGAHVDAEVPAANVAQQGNAVQPDIVFDDFAAGWDW